MLPIAGHKTWLRQWVGIEHQILSLFAAGAILHGNYSFLALCNPSGRTTGLAGGTEAAAAVAVGPVRAAPLGWPSRSPGSALNQDSSQPSTIQSMKWAQAALLGTEWLGLVAEGAGSPLVDIAEGSSSFTGWLISLCVSIRAWGTRGSRPMHWPVTLDFSWHCQH